MAALIAAVAGLTVVVPAVLEFIEARRFGFGWQGRYTLPFAVGLPILCGFALSQRPKGILARRRVAIVVGAIFGVTFVVAQFGAFAQNLRRYTVGHTGSLLIWQDPAWSPSVSPLLLLIGYAVLLVALAVWLCAGAVTGPPDSPAADRDNRVAAPASDQVPGLEYTRSG
jgi:hypothetical protein